MLYILTEDEGAGYQFWTAVNKRLLGNRAKVISTHGCGNVLYLLGVKKSKFAPKSMEPLPIKGTDGVLVFLDDTGDDMVSKTMDILSDYYREHPIAHYIHITGIYSFEELILSFTDLEKWVDNPDKLLRNAITDIRKSADTSGDRPYSYWSACSSWITQFEEKYGTRFSTREQLSKAVLYRFTKYIKSFEIRPVKPSKLGACWYTSCANRTQQGYTKDCEKCGLTNHRLTGAQKLLELNDKSLMSAPGRFTLRDLVKLVKEEG